MNKKVFILLFVIIFSVSFLLPSSVNSDDTSWWNPDFFYRNVYYINSSLVDEVLIDFPVLVYLNSSYVDWSVIQDNLNDLRFVNSSNFEIPFEIDSFIVNNEAWLWTSLSLISNVSDTKFFMYYGFVFDDCLIGEDIENVWFNFSAVYHLNDNSTSTVLDSTSYDNDGTKGAVNEPLEVSGNIGMVQDGDGLDDYIDCLNDNSLNAIDDKFSVEFWINLDGTSATGQDQVFNKANAYYVARNINQLTFAFYTGSAWETVTSNALPVSWNYIVGIYDTITQKLFVNGVSQNPESKVVTVNAPSSYLYLFARRSGGLVDVDHVEALVDELRISNISRSDTWVKANYETGKLNLLWLEESDTFFDISLRSDIDDNTLLIFVVLIVACSSFLVTITHKRREK